ncbi:probable WRKY transcription factor 65 isoform X2 [Solanum dulcamara]|uniref:probable WRKY transcription factor 65 isoform X2 n=1 Tax=Solanum dulcamara TaxID=45834 RepID=UPI002486B4C9|nr:probable WRKY transcription factor 65 isoform X2 [Solanum dulcamara]
MDGRFNNFFVSEQEDSENSPENSSDSPCSGMLNDNKMMTSTSSPKRRRSIEKRVVSVPIKEVEGSKMKGEISMPPSDSWAWRKYGQKPIKGSPYPRGYYRCSSSKGCPARKQVERSRADPNMLVVTYSCEHNHSWPASRNNQHNHRTTTTTSCVNNNTKTKMKTIASLAAAATTIIAMTTTTSSIAVSEENTTSDFARPSEPNSVEKFANLGEPSSLISANEFGWFSDLIECTSTTMLESPILTEIEVTDIDMSSTLTMREEDVLLFADLGELPECSTVFGRGMMERDEERRRNSLTTWCGTTG